MNTNTQAQVKVCMLHRFPTNYRAGWELMDGEIPCTATYVSHNRVVITNAKGNVMASISDVLYGALLERQMITLDTYDADA